MSEEACTWAQTTRAKNRSAKFVLMRLAAYADANGVAWAFVSLLATQIDGDDRTVQRALRALEKAGLIRKTGRFHGRNVPYYQLDMDGAIRAAMAGANGDNLSPLEPDPTVTTEASNGDTGTTQKKGNNSSEGSKEPPSERAGAGAIADVCEAAFEAYPIEGRRGPSSLKLWRVAWASEVAGGVSGLVLLGAVRAYAGDRRSWGSSGRPKAAHAWLEGGCWDGFVIEATSPANALGPAHWNGPAEIRAQVVTAQGEGFARSWLDHGSWNGSAVVARTRIAAERLRQVLKGTDVVVLDPPKGGEGVG